MPPKANVPRITEVINSSKPRTRPSRSSASTSRAREYDDSDEQSDAPQRANTSSSNASRKRTRAAPPITSTASPNPKARKSLKTKAEPVEHDNDSDEYLEDRQSTSSSRQTRTVKSKANRSTTRTKAPKPAPLSKQAKHTAQSGKGRRLPNLPPLDDSEPCSDGDDPLLLVGHNQWVPAPWRPQYHDDASDAVKKEEDEVSAAFFLADPSASNSPVRSTADTTLDPQHIAAAIGHPAFNLPSDEEEEDPEPGHRDPDSSFVGMEIDSEQEVSDFIAPVRMNSPPSRKRRSSNVSQRVPTPGISNPSDRGGNDGSPTRPVTYAEPRSPIARPLGRKEVLGSPGPLSFAAFTPRDPRGQSLASEHAPSYPSPAFKGKALGSLSPEKGRGPSRGLLPKLRESIELDSPPASLTSTSVAQVEDVKQDVGNRKRSASRPLLASSSPESNTPLDLQPYPNLTQRLTATAFDNSLKTSDTAERGRSTSRGHLEPQGSTELRFTFSNESVTTTEQEDDREEHTRSVSLQESTRESAREANEPEAPHLRPGPRIDIQTSVQDLSLEELVDYGDGEIDDDEAMPLVEISSRDPMVAARAAAILKLHHDYLEDSRLRSLRFNTRQKTPMGMEAGDITDSEPALVIPPHLIREAEREVSTPPAARTQHHGGTVPSPAPVRNHTHVRTASGRVLVPGTPSYPTRPVVMVDPASSRTSDANDSSNESSRAWTKGEWKHLEACLLGERDRLAMEHGLVPRDVDVGDVDIDWVVQHFLDQERLVGDEDGWEGNGEWARSKIRRRCMALQVRHSKKPQGSITIPGSPMVMPLTPLPSRENTPLLLSDLAPSGDSRERQPFPSTSNPSLLPASLTAPRYGHLYDEAALTARLPRPAPHAYPHQPLQHDSPTPLPGSRRSLSLTRLREPSVDSPRRAARPQSTQPLPSRPNVSIDTPTATSRVLNLLGLGESVPLGPKDVTTSSTANPIIRSRQARSASPGSQSMRESRTQDDLNHIDFESGSPVERLPHPKDLVVLHPVPPKEDPEPEIRGRRISGGSVKDLVRDFEAMEAEKAKERARVSGIVIHGRHSSHSLTRKRSNLSTSQPITAEWDTSMISESSLSDIVLPSTPVSVSAPANSRFGFSLTGSLRKVPWFRS